MTATDAPSRAGVATLGVENPDNSGQPVDVDAFSWQRGLVYPDRLHIPETEDGRPRMLLVGNGTVVIAICQAWLPGDLTPVDLDSTDSSYCQGCLDLARQLPPHWREGRMPWR